jgi:phosphatidate cytidylyltransferase
MLRTRLIVGTLMAVGVVTLVAFDRAHWRPFYPGLMFVTFALGWLATTELLALFPAEVRPHRFLTLASVAVVLLANWCEPWTGFVFGRGFWLPKAWGPVFVAFLGAVWVAVATEVVTYTGPGVATARMANAVFSLVYLGVLPSCLIRLAWVDSDTISTELLLAVFVPKCGDIGAYFTGRLFGRHPMAPRLSPKKTWEGFAGGLAAAVSVAVWLGPRSAFLDGVPRAVAFGVAVGVAGVIGDLAESMIKRDAQAKDASASVPGFGGVLDVIDSVIFAAPVAYLFLAR